ncbi:MAG TPA: hypothetical protein VEM58_14060, partial [Streptosporangiaceae bacterium]|nr:hypothetical protein [Streptosporangiaceae bacterium]
AARMYRALGDFTLAWAGGEAAFLALDPSQQAADISAWTRAYLAVDRAEHPHIWQIRDELAGVTEDDIFETILGLVMQGFVVQAPRPCGCGMHPAPASPAGQPAAGEAS